LLHIEIIPWYINFVFFHIIYRWENNQKGYVLFFLEKKPTKRKAPCSMNARSSRHCCLRSGSRWWIRADYLLLVPVRGELVEPWTVYPSTSSGRTG
jgi:hypothetical protein